MPSSRPSPTATSAPQDESAARQARLPDEAVVEDKILALTGATSPAGTVDPSDVARALMPADQWQRALPVVRRVAVRLARAGRLLLYRKGKPVEPEALRGVYRLGAPHDE